MRFLSLLAALLSSQARALPQGESVLPADGVFSLQMGKPEMKGKVSRVKVDGLDGKDAASFETLADGENPWDIQAELKSPKAIKKGDKLLASFWMRGTKSRQESGEALSIFVVEESHDPWRKSAEFPVRGGRGWKQFFCRFEASQDYAPGEAQVLFRMGYAPQAFEVADLKVENFGQKLKLEDLPVTKLTYGGREANAPWRKAAEERILQLRTAPLKVTVLDAKGAAVKGAKVSVTQLSNAFGFGTAVSSELRANGPAAVLAKYEAAFAENFNAAVEENGFKWQPLAGDWGTQWTLPRALETAKWVKGQGKLFRGHVLLWPGYRNLPKSVQALGKDKGKVMKAVAEHITELASKTRGIADHWDVINEPFDNHDLLDLFGDGLMVDAFKLARAANPEAKLFINDYAILVGGGGDTPHRRHYEKTLKYLVSQAAPFDAFGMQGHFGASLTDPEDALKILDRYAAAAPGKQIWITEYDIDINDLELAGDYTRDLLTLFYSHPAAGGFMMWGFWDGAHWHNNAPLFGKDWKPKPALKAWQDLVLKKWRTKAGGSSGADGSFSVRGHLGEYAVTAESGGKKGGAKVSLAKGGAGVEIRLK